MKAMKWIFGCACLGLLLTAVAWGPEPGPPARGGGGANRRGTALLAVEAGRTACGSDPVLPDPLPRDGLLETRGPDAGEAVCAIQERLMQDLVVIARLTGSQRDLAREVLLRLERQEQELLAHIDFDSLTQGEADRINGRLDEIALNARRDLERLLLPGQVRAFEEWCHRTGLTAPAALAVLDEDAGE